VAHGDPWDERQYEMYPPALKSPYGERRSAFGKERQLGAPAALFCYIDRDLGRPQWADVGMYLQTVMLLLRAEGLHSCPQMAWSQVRETVAEVLSPSDGLILFCGMSIGYEDPTVRYARTGRAPVDARGPDGGRGAAGQSHEADGPRARRGRPRNRAQLRIVTVLCILSRQRSLTAGAQARVAAGWIGEANGPRDIVDS
jgi:hypothetical protein